MLMIDQNRNEKIILLPSEKDFPIDDLYVLEILTHVSTRFGIELIGDNRHFIETQSQCIFIINIFDKRQKPFNIVENVRKDHPDAHLLFLCDKECTSDDVVTRLRELKSYVITKPLTSQALELYVIEHLGFRSFEYVKGGVPCPACRNWRCRQDDAFCARCRKQLVMLQIEEQEIRFEQDGQSKLHKQINVKNAGINPLIMTYDIQAKPYLKNCFRLSTERTVINGGCERKISITFNTHNVENSKEHSATLVISSNEGGSKTHEIYIIIERSPILRIDLPNPLNLVRLDRNELGSRLKTDSVIRLFNDGGGTLSLKTVTINGTLMTFPGAVSIKSTDSVTLPLEMLASDSWKDDQAVKIKFSFSEISSLEYDTRAVIIDPPLLAIEQKHIDFNVISAKRSKLVSITIRNTGGNELIISQMSFTETWAETSANFPLHVSSGTSMPVDIAVHGPKAVPGRLSFYLNIQSNAYNADNQQIPCEVTVVEPKKHESYIGIDFGTTASCIAVFDDKKKQVQVLDIDHDGHRALKIMPSVLYFDENGNTLVGYSAKEQAMIQPANAVNSIKRALGRVEKHVFAGQEYTPTELATKIIAKLIDRAEEALFSAGRYETPYKAVVTVPIEFSENQRKMVREACQQAGLDIESEKDSSIIIDEAQAAGFAYLASKEEVLERERVLIFDFGGGTLDCAIVEIAQTGERTVFKTLAVSGDSNFGGEDIDWEIVRSMAAHVKESIPEFDEKCVDDDKKFKHTYRVPNHHLAAIQSRANLKRQAEEAKITLSSETAFTVAISPILNNAPSPPEYYVVNTDGRRIGYSNTLNRENLNALLIQFASKCEEVVKDLCERANIAPNEVDTIIHVGRSSAIPLIRESLTNILRDAQDKSTLIEPKLCVAKGAAYWGNIKDLPTDIELVSLGVCTRYDLGYLEASKTKFGERDFKPVIKSGTTLPVTKEISVESGKKLIIARRRSREMPKDIYQLKVNSEHKNMTVLFQLDQNEKLTVSINGVQQNLISLTDGEDD